MNVIRVGFGFFVGAMIALPMACGARVQSGSVTDGGHESGSIIDVSAPDASTGVAVAVLDAAPDVSDASFGSTPNSGGCVPPTATGNEDGIGAYCTAGGGQCEQIV